MLNPLPEILIALTLNAVHLVFYVRLKTRKPLTFLLAFALMLIPSALLLRAVSPGIGPEIPGLPAAAAILTAAYLLWVVRLLLTNDGSKRLVFAGVSVHVFTHTLRTLSFVVLIHGFRTPPGEALRLSWHFVAPALVLLMPILYRYARKPFMRSLDIVETQRWRLVVLPPAALSFLSFSTMSLFTGSQVSAGELVQGVAVPIAILAYFASLFGFLASKNEALVYRQRLEAAERLGAAYAFYDSELAEKESRLRTLRHDFRHLGVHLATLAEERDFEGILKELRAVSGTAEETAVTPFCENRTVNAITSFHFSRAEKMGVNCVAKTFVPGKLSLPEAELALLLGNALENAVKAAGPLGERGYIAFEARPSRGYMMFVFENNYERGKYVAGEGAGLASIRKLCESRNGWMKTEEEGENVRRLTVFLSAL